MVHLRKRLAVFMKARRGRMPQRDFARKTGVAQSTIMRIENMDQNVTLDTLEQVCRSFRCDVGDLFPVSYSRSREHRSAEPMSLHELHPDWIRRSSAPGSVSAGKKPAPRRRPSSAGRR